MSTATEARTGPTTRSRIAAALPVTIALTLIGGVWAAGAVWSFEEQTAFAKDAGFHLPELLPVVLDGMAAAMAAVAYAASLDARPAVFARLVTALAVACSAGSNVAWAWERSDGDVQTIALAGGVPVVANLAFEVLLSEIRRQVLRRRGQPGPVAIVYPRMVRLFLSPWPTFAAWRRLVLDATDPKRDFDRRPPIKATVVDESDPDVQACRQLQREMAAARQALAPQTARIALADHALHWSAVADRPATPLAVAAPTRPALPATATPTPAAGPTTVADPEPATKSTTEPEPVATEATTKPTTVPATKSTTRRRTVVARTDHAATTKPRRKSTTKAVTKPTTAGSEADRTAAAYAAFVADHGRAPSGAELATMAGVSKSYANNWKRDNAPTTEEDTMPKPSRIAERERDLIAAKGDPERHAQVRQEIRAAGLPELAAELDRIAATDPSQES